MDELPSGLRLHPGLFDHEAQLALAREIASAIAAAPLYTSTMPKTDAPMSVRMTHCSDFGWYSDKNGGYRYETRHPRTREPWPPIPAAQDRSSRCETCACKLTQLPCSRASLGKTA